VENGFHYKNEVPTHLCPQMSIMHFFILDDCSNDIGVEVYIIHHGVGEFCG